MFITLVGNKELHLWEIFPLHMWAILLRLWKFSQLWDILLHLRELLHLENFITRLVGPTDASISAFTLYTSTCMESHTSDTVTFSLLVYLFKNRGHNKFHSVRAVD